MEVTDGTDLVDLVLGPGGDGGAMAALDALEHDSLGGDESPSPDDFAVMEGDLGDAVPAGASGVILDTESGEGEDMLEMVEAEIRNAETALARNLTRRREGGRSVPRSSGASPGKQRVSRVSPSRTDNLCREAPGAAVSSASAGESVSTAREQGQAQSLARAQAAAADAVSRALNEVFHGKTAASDETGASEPARATPSHALGVEGAEAGGPTEEAAGAVEEAGMYLPEAGVAVAESARASSPAADRVEGEGSHGDEGTHSDAYRGYSSYGARAGGVGVAGTAGAADRGGVHVPGADVLGGSYGRRSQQSSRYGDKSERDALITRLLAERKARLAERPGAASAPSSTTSGIAAAAPVALAATPRSAVRTPSTTGSLTLSRLRQPGSVDASTKITPAAAATRIPWKSSEPPPPPASVRVPDRPLSRQDVDRDTEEVEVREYGLKPQYAQETEGRRVPERKSGRPPASYSKSRAHKSSAKMEQLRREVEAKRMQECTFKPKINKYSSSRRSRRMTKEERLESLSQPKTNKFEEREAQKAREEEDNQNRFTFRPQINSAPTKGPGRFGEDTEDLPVQERLYREAERRKKQREQMERERKLNEVGALPFRPTINPDTAKHVSLDNYRPIHERVADIQRSKEESLQRLRMDAVRTNPDLTFQPKINVESEKLARERIQEVGDAPVTERLVADANEAMRRRKERVQAWQEIEASEHTFAPAVNPHSEWLVSQHRPEYNEEFVKRQELLADKRDHRVGERLEDLRATVGGASECTFKPNIDASKRFLQRRKPGVLRETSEQRLKRLAGGDRARIEEKRQAQEDEYYSQFTFEPQITERSRAIGSAMSIDELVKDEKRTRAISKLKKEREAAFKAQHTFKPERVAAELDGEAVKKYQLDLANPEHLGDKMDELRRRRDEKLEETRRRLEYEQLKGCTFQPGTNPGQRSEGDQPVVVRGLGRFLELKEMAKRLDEEKHEREEAAYRVNPAAFEAKPFKLSDDPRRNERKRKVLRAAYEAEMKECTFHPRTMEGTIHSLLKEELDAEAKA